MQNVHPLGSLVHPQRFDVSLGSELKETEASGVQSVFALLSDSNMTRRRRFFICEGITTLFNLPKAEDIKKTVVEMYVQYEQPCNVNKQVSRQTWSAKIGNPVKISLLLGVN